MELVPKTILAALMLAAHLAGAQTLPVYTVVGKGAEYSVLIGSAHAGYIGASPFDLSAVSEIRRARLVYFEFLPLSRDVSIAIRNRLAASIPLNTLSTLYGKLEALVAEYGTRPRLVETIKLLRAQNVHPLFAHHLLLAECGQQHLGRSLDEEIKTLLSPQSQVVELEDVNLMIADASEISAQEWSDHLERVAGFAVGSLCGDIADQVLLDISGFIFSDDMDALARRYESFHKATLASDLIYTKIEHSARRQRYMADRIAVLHNQSPAAFVVGASHLGGKAGLIEELRKRGFTVSKLRRSAGSRSP